MGLPLATNLFRKDSRAFTSSRRSPAQSANVLLSIGYWKLLCTNFNNQAGVNTDTLKRVKIPLPPKEIQDQIAAELMQRRSQANVLRRQAIKEWADAKAQFEKELLGE